MSGPLFFLGPKSPDNIIYYINYIPIELQTYYACFFFNGIISLILNIPFEIPDMHVILASTEYLPYTYSFEYTFPPIPSTPSTDISPIIDISSPPVKQEREF